MSTRRMTFGQATLEAMQYAMDEDPSVLVIGEDISWGGNFGQFRGLVDRYGPDRVVDMPISEAVDAVLGGIIDVDQAIVQLMARPQRAE